MARRDSRRAYGGTPCYPPDESWVVPARFEAYDVPQDQAVGDVVLERGGVEHRLVAWGEDDGCLWILFRDATSGTWSHGRRPSVRMRANLIPMRRSSISRP